MIKHAIKEFIYIQKQKIKLPYYTEVNKTAFKEIEKDFFNNNKIINLISFKTFNTIAFKIGDYAENKTYSVYENDLIKECVLMVENDLKEIAQTEKAIKGGVSE